MVYLVNYYFINRKGKIKIVMKSMVCKISNLFINIHYEYDLIHTLCKDYIVSDFGHIDINIDNINIDKYKGNNRIEAAEVLGVLEKFAESIFDYNMLLIHGAAIEYNNKAYLFMAPSGTGKSTHIKHWKEVLKDVHIINGDKPIIDDKAYVYGTPWCGKEGWGNPVSYKLDSLIFIERDKFNHIEKLETKNCLNSLLKAVYLPKKEIEKVFDLINKIFINIPIYRMYCIDDTSAAKVCISEVIK